MPKSSDWDADLTLSNLFSRVRAAFPNISEMMAEYAEWTKLRSRRDELDRRNAFYESCRTDKVSIMKSQRAAMRRAKRKM